MTSILTEANEKLDRYYEIKSQGYTIEKVEKRVIEIFGIERDVIYSKGRRKIQVAAKSLLCYWAVRELGLTATALAKRLWDDAARGELCGHPRRANRQRKQLHFSRVIY